MLLLQTKFCHGKWSFFKKGQKTIGSYFCLRKNCIYKTVHTSHTLRKKCYFFDLSVQQSFMMHDYFHKIFSRTKTQLLPHEYCSSGILLWVISFNPSNHMRQLRLALFVLMYKCTEVHRSSGICPKSQSQCQTSIQRSWFVITPLQYLPQKCTD